MRYVPVKTIQKNSEFTYGVHAGFLNRYVDDNQATILAPDLARQFLNKLDLGVMGSVRSLNQQVECLRQGIAYTMPFKLRSDGAPLFLVYLRNKVNNEGQLTQKLSLAPGGHIEHSDIVKYEEEDGLCTEVINFTKTLETNLVRELMEEVEFSSETYSSCPHSLNEPMTSFIADHTYPVGFVMDSKPEPGYVGNIHFGVIYMAEVAEEDTTFVMKEPQNEAVGWFTAVELLAQLNSGGLLGEGDHSTTVDGPQFEPWSQLIIKEMATLVPMLKALSQSDK